MVDKTLVAAPKEGFLSKVKRGIEAAGIAEFEKTEEAAPVRSAAPAAPGTRSAASTALPYDPDILAQLQGVVAKKKTPYATLIETSDAMAGAITDENTRLRAAAQMLMKTGGRKANEFIQAIDIHVADLENERRNFKAAVETRIAREAGEARRNATLLLDANKRNADDIASLEQRVAQQRAEIVKNEERVRELTAQADAIEADNRSVEAKFDVTTDYLKSELASRKSSLATLLS